MLVDVYEKKGEGKEDGMEKRKKDGRGGKMRTKRTGDGVLHPKQRSDRKRGLFKCSQTTGSLLSSNTNHDSSFCRLAFLFAFVQQTLSESGIGNHLHSSSEGDPFNPVYINKQQQTESLQRHDGEKRSA